MEVIMMPDGYYGFNVRGNVERKLTEDECCDISYLFGTPQQNKTIGQLRKESREMNKKKKEEQVGFPVKRNDKEPTSSFMWME